MFKKIHIVFLIAICMAMVFSTCTEPFEVETTDFEDILIINASITTDARQHEIYISRSYEQGGEEVKASGATVEVLVNGDSPIQFEQVSPGVYRSTIVFAAEPGTDYQLRVIDENGEIYTSPQVQSTTPTTIDEISARRVLNEDGQDGVEIYVDGTASSDNAAYFRYEYVETYRIESFYQLSKELVVASESPPILELRIKEREEKTCYKTEESNSIMIAETNNLAENKVVDFPLLFMERRDRRVAHRYSILVKQYAQTSVSYEFYRTLKNFSSSSNLFSQVQPGLIVGNIDHIGTGNVKVIGLFEVVSVSSRRLFFSFEEIFQNNGDIRYLGDCEETAYHISDLELFERIQSGHYRLTGELPFDNVTIALKNCVDCTLEGSNQVPEFWVEQ